MHKTTASDLRAERAKHRLTQQSVAAALGMTGRALRNWETDQVELTPEKVDAFRAAVARLVEARKGNQS